MTDKTPLSSSNTASVHQKQPPPKTAASVFFSAAIDLYHMQFAIAGQCCASALTVLPNLPYVEGFPVWHSSSIRRTQAAAKVFAFSLQREVNRELGTK